MVKLDSIRNKLIEDLLKVCLRCWFDETDSNHLSINQPININT